MSGKTIANSSTGSMTTLTIPGSSVDGEVAVFSGTSGSVIGGGHGITISSTGNFSGILTLVILTSLSI